jgi:hypothetical protein
MREWVWWLQGLQHEWWFIPAGLLLLATVLAIVFGVRIAYTRFMGWVMSPRMRMTDDQVEAQWATSADLEKFGLIKPKKGVRSWIAR